MQVIAPGMLDGLSRLLRKVYKETTDDELAEDISQWIAWLESMPIDR